MFSLVLSALCQGLGSADLESQVRVHLSLLLSKSLPGTD